MKEYIVTFVDDTDVADIDRFERIFGTNDEIVRCKDCKYNVANMQKDPLDITDYTDIVCSYFMTDGMDPHDFCSKGATE